MTDARSDLYERYVSSFKSDHGQGTDDPFPETRWYEFSRFRHYRSLYLPLLEGLDPDARILELGCGPGDMLEFLDRSGFHDVVGIDISAEQVAVARERGHNARTEDVFDFLQSNSERWDVVIAKDFFEHFTLEELLELSSRLEHALVDGGRMIIETPNGRGLHPGQVIYGDLTHRTILTPQSLPQLLKPFGFSNFRFYETGPTPTYPLGVLRVAGWALVKWAANLVRLVEQGKYQSLWSENMICVCTKTSPE